MIKTKSSTCSKGFEYNDGLLKVQYKKGKTYIYEGVSKEMFTNLKRCESIGAALSKIRCSCKCYKEI